MKMRTVIGLMVMSALAAGAASPQFEEVPAGANRALKAVKGKPIRTGMVFVNGHYVKPPYVLMRSGTALFNYNTQITGQVVPWRAFLATQGGAAAQKPAAPVKPRTAQSVDDLFADTPPAAQPQAAAPAANDVEDVDFTPNEQSKRLLKRINDRRSFFDRKLREGDVIFFGSRYAPVIVSEPRLVRELMAMLPEAIRDSSDGADLFGKMRGKGITYMTREICDELIENRTDYTQLVERRKDMEKADELNKLLQQGVR